MKAVIIEDTPDIASMLALALTSEGWEVVTILEDFGRVLDPARWDGVDVAVVDWHLGQDPRDPSAITGETILAFVAANAPRVRRLLISAMPQVPGATTAHQVIAKPFTWADLLAACRG